jgi:molecular chaperone GrpE
MSEPRRAGEPERPRRPAGAPQAESGTPGVPPGSRGAADEDPRGAEEAARAEVERDLDAMLAETKRERDEYLELARRARADFENYRKRAARDATEAERRGRSSLARELVPALDNLERALRAAGVDPDNEPGDSDPAAPRRAGAPGREAEDAPSEEPGDAAGNGSGLAHGVGLVLRDLRDTLKRAGVESYDPIGERFDPSWHEALATKPADGAEPGIVLETVEKGYRLDGNVLRAARVIVSE